MFSNSATIYDAVYSFKDYVAESELLRALIEERSPGASTLLDVACGTGKHLEQLRRSYEGRGVDLDPELLAGPRGPPGGRHLSPLPQRDLPPCPPVPALSGPLLPI